MLTKAAILLKEKERREARDDFEKFIKLVKPDYVFNWHHLEIIERLQEFLTGDVKKLMIFLPPQHGKSELVSRLFPAFALGTNPNLKIAACSYNLDLAMDFNSDVKKIISNPEYQNIFPNTRIAEAGEKGKNTAKFFQILNQGGFYKSVGVLGGLTGKTVELGIIDDPIKDDIEAQSKTYRERVWKWYLKVFRTRLNNSSKQILLMTRWHKDDLAGRILKLQPHQWEVISYPALAKDDEPNRKKGDPLWPEKHSKEKLEEEKQLSPSSFPSLYQQNPVAEGGNIVKKAWFGTYDPNKVQFFESPQCVFDTALKAKEGNDPSAGLSFVYQDNVYYLIDYQSGRMEFPELCEFIPDFYNASNCSFAWVENKASGVSAVQAIRRTSSINIEEYKVPGVDKEARLRTKLDLIKGGRVLLPKRASWVEGFLEEICSFPNAPHDEAVDCLTMTIDITQSDFDLDLN